MMKIQALVTSLFFLFQLNLFGETWLTPVDLSCAGKNSRMPQVAVNDLGQTVASWVTGKDTKVAMMAWGGSWLSPVELKTSLNEMSYAPMVKINNLGEMIVVWGGEFDVGPYGGVFYSTGVFGQRWAIPASVYLGQLDIDSMVAFNNKGEAVALIDNEITPTEIKALKLCFGGSWFNPTVISEMADESKGARVAMNDNGQIVAVWEAEKNADENIVHGLYSIFSGSWPSVFPLYGIPLSVLGQNAESPQVSLNSLGQIVVVWRRYNGFNWIIQSVSATIGSGWSIPVDLSIPSENGKEPQVAMNDAGQVVAVWCRNNGSNKIIQVSMMLFGESWSVPIDLSEVGQDAESPQVVINNSGQVVVVWKRFNGTNDIIQAATCNFCQSWSVPIDLSAVGQDAEAPQVTMNDKGQAVAVWSRSNGVKKIIQSSSTSMCPWPPVNLSGSQIGLGSMNSVTSYFNRLTWEASSTDSVTYYNVYRNGILAGIVNNDKSILMFEDWNQVRGVPINYAVSAVSSGGGESNQVGISIP